MSLARLTDSNDHKLPLMTSRCVAPLLALIIVEGSIACSGERSQKKNDSITASQVNSPPITGSSIATGWDSAAGRVLMLSGSKNPADVAIVLPGVTDSVLAATSHFELRSLANVPVELFGSRGLVGQSILRTSSQSSDPAGCFNWPTGVLMNGAPSDWKIALEKGRAIGLSLDSLEGMKGVDSAQFVKAVVNAALSITEKSDPVFRGIPFAVRKGYRFVVSSKSVIIAEVVRRINEEANPREEHLLLVAEQPSTSTDYRVAYHVRSAGAEESLETSEVLAAIRLRNTNRPAIVITFEYEDGGKIALLERLGENIWQVVWKSASTGC